MPKEKSSFAGVLCGDEPGLLARLFHSLSGKDEGVWGERCIVKLLKNRMDGASVFQNVYVPVDGRTTELDIVMVSSYGIFVFESKAFGGKIYGHSDHMNWIQYIGGTKNTFYNPVKQNENHCRYLSQALQLPRQNLFSYVVFENRADLSKVSSLGGDGFVVCSRNRLRQSLMDNISGRHPVFSDSEVSRICSKLKEWSRSKADRREQHISQVQQRMFSDVCPLCGKKLVEREGKYGPFIACTGYPQCTYTRKIKTDR